MLPENAAEICMVDGQLHCDTGPAIIYANGKKEYYNRGQLHRFGDAAVINVNGSKAYYNHGICHRPDGPAIEGEQNEWYIMGKHVGTEATKGVVDAGLLASINRALAEYGLAAYTPAYAVGVPRKAPASFKSATLTISAAKRMLRKDYASAMAGMRVDPSS